MTMETSRRLLQRASIALRSQHTGSGKSSTLPLLQISSLRPTLYSIEKLGQRKESFHCDRSVLKRGVDYPTTTSENMGRASQLPVILRSRQDSIKLEGSFTSRPSLRNEASIDRALLSEKMETLDEHSKTTFREPKSSARVVGTEGSNRAMISSRSKKASTNFQNGIQSHKDQREPWQIQKKALSEKFGPTGWLPRKRLSPDTLEGIRALHAQYPDRFTTPILADQFKVSPEAIRRILKSRWRPNDEEEETRRRRWEKRGVNIWSQMVQMGIKPPKKWREMGVRKYCESTPFQSKRFESQMKSGSISSPRGQSNKNLHTILANGDEIGSPVFLSDRIL